MECYGLSGENADVFSPAFKIPSFTIVLTDHTGDIHIIPRAFRKTERKYGFNFQHIWKGSILLLPASSLYHSFAGSNHRTDCGLWSIIMGSPRLDPGIATDERLWI